MKNVKTRLRRYAETSAAILLLQVSLALAAQPGATQPAPVSVGAVLPPAAPVPAMSRAAAAPLSLAQAMQQAQTHPPVIQPPPFFIPMPHSHNPFSPYMPVTVPPPNLTNAPLLYSLIRGGRLYLSMRDAIALAIENNLDLAYFRYNFPIAQTDLARTNAGGFANGVNIGIRQAASQGGFSSSGGGGGESSSSAGAGAGGIVTSTLGAGAPVPSFDPYLNFNGYLNHTVTQEGNIFQVGVPTFKQNNIEALAQYTQSFRLGTNLTINYQGQRFANNGPYYAINPTLYSNFQLQLSQPLLAGFGFASNERFIVIAKQDITVTNLAFRAQVSATITQVENIYWDLVNAYEDVQVKERSLAFAQKTLQDDEEQLKLHAIPALQVMKDETDVASSEGDLTISRAKLRLNELMMKNALTRSDDPAIDEMPVIPLDRTAPPDPNASKTIDALIAEAEKNRPDVAEEQIAMDKARASLRSIRSELLPQLNLYGIYGGAGIAGPKNPYCSLGPAECNSDLPSSFGSMLANTFNYSSPNYQVGMTLSINLRNRVYKADQLRAVLEYRQQQVNYEEQKKSIRFDVRNALFALQQDEASMQAERTARDLAQRTFDITVREQKLGAVSSYDTLVAQHALAIAQSALAAAQTTYEKAKVSLDYAIGETLVQTGVSIADAKTGVLSNAP